MARRPVRQMNPNSRYVSGDLAYDYDYLERERRRREERELREYADRRMREAPAPQPQPRRRTMEAPKHRERLRVSPVVLLGFTAAAVMVVLLLMSYAELTAISGSVVRMQRELATLEDEHVALVGRYEKTFDLATVKEAAEAAGMAKPSASQVYYIDLSAPDNVVLYQRAEANVLGRVAASVGRDVVSVLEYFK